MKAKYSFLLAFCLLIVVSTHASYLLIPMDKSQTNHLKSYGIAYWLLQQEVEVSWLLNYRGGSFMCTYNESFVSECKIRGVSYQVLADVQATAILSQIAQQDENMCEIKLNKAPRIAVYSPKNKLPWDGVCGSRSVS